MASSFVEAEEESVEELRNTSENKNTKRVRATGLTFSMPLHIQTRVEST